MRTDARVHQLVGANDARGRVSAERDLEDSLRQVAAGFAAPCRTGLDGPGRHGESIVTTRHQLGMHGAAHDNVAMANASSTLVAASPKTSCAARGAPTWRRSSSK